MKFKERIKKIDLFFNIEKELEIKNLELKEIEQKISNNKGELEKINQKISNKKTELESLKTEILELKDFINSKFKEEFKEYDYKVNIINCYIISINGKKYITLKKHETSRCDWYTLGGGHYNVEYYLYYDVLSVDNKGKYKYLYEYRYGHFDNVDFYPLKFKGQKPDYEEHILKVYPELSIFIDNYVPNTYLKKIYYEINDLSNKKLIK